MGVFLSGADNAVLLREQRWVRWTQGHSILRNYWISRLFFKDPVRLGNRTYRAWWVKIR